MPDLPDHRDIVYSAVRPVPAVLPPAVDLRPKCLPVEDQGQLASCTANALVGALEYLELKDKVPFGDLSRLFIYYNERVIEHSVKSDAGAHIRDGIKTLAKAVIAVGYHDDEKRFIVRNSWGNGWGMRGYFSMPYDYLADPNLAEDFWTIRRGEKI